MRYPWGYRTSTNKWVKWSDSLPDEESRVLCTIKSQKYKGVRSVRAGMFAVGYFHGDNGETYKPGDKDLVAWCYLPAPYKEETDEQDHTT